MSTSPVLIVLTFWLLLSGTLLICVGLPEDFQVSSETYN